MGLLEGKAIAITGSGRGLGEAYAKHAAAEGARVLVNDIDRDEAHRVVDLIRNAGGEAQADTSDISQWEGASALIGACVDHFGAVDGFVNNAAIFHMASIDDEDELRIRRAVDVNILGTTFCGLLALRQMRRQGAGSLVNIVSGAQAGIFAMSAYGATKGAAASLTYAWALETAGTAVRVNAASPIAQTRTSSLMVDYMRNLGRDVPVEISPESNAPIVGFLLSDLACDINGQVVRIQGGEVSLLTHPASLHPSVVRDTWTIRDVADAFDEGLRARQLPLGMHSYQIAWADYGVPYARPTDPPPILERARASPAG